MTQMESAPGPRITIDGQDYDYFCGTGYYALHGHPALADAACAAMRQYGTGSATSRAGYGNTPVLLEVEQKAARFFGAESALYHVSAYFGNAILLQGLTDRYDIVFADEQSHYSILDGAAMARKRVVFFKHRDTEDLSRKIKETLAPTEVPLVISDGVFPASGELAPLTDYQRVLADYDQAILCVDDAHATGVIGEKGRGTLEHAGLLGTERCYASYTLSKAIGGHGGLIAGSSAFIDQLKAHINVYKGSSSVPTPAAAATAKALDILSESPKLRQQLWDSVAYAKAAIRKLGFDNIPDTPVPIICLSSDTVDLEQLQMRLQEKEILVQFLSGGSYSSVPSSDVIRIAIFATHTKQQIDNLCFEMKRLLQKN